MPPATKTISLGLTAASVLAQLQSASSQIAKKPLDSCISQNDCVSWSITPAGDNCEEADGTCDQGWYACMHITDAGDCPSTISHTCEKTECMPDDTWNMPVLRNLPVPHVECQYGKPGDMLFFLITDGNQCSESLTPPDVPAGTCDAGLRCYPRPSEVMSCTGNPAVKECVWEIQLPTECSCTDPVTTPAPTPGLESMPEGFVAPNQAAAAINRFEVAPAGDGEVAPGSVAISVGAAGLLAVAAAVGMHRRRSNERRGLSVELTGEDEEQDHMEVASRGEEQSPEVQ